MYKQELNSSYQEIIRLENMLTDADIQHRIERAEDGWHICYPDYGERCVCSVIEFTGSQGAKKDRLEIKGLLNKEEKKFNTVVGHLSAENVFERIRRDWERRKKRREKVES
ncbi:MAG: hypothetical protein IKH57_25825 [Clostridia bacterium]|nr:hypothetical protein [Clostridia bacterium]